MSKPLSVHAKLRKWGSVSPPGRRQDLGSHQHLSPGVAATQALFIPLGGIKPFLKNGIQNPGKLRSALPVESAAMPPCSP